ncbi:MAG: methyltransferase domain-containing protein [Gemmatimonadota bacterium]|nr:MAG: methyltransferase domain-containing protein [Gemmatimonadota bacterium]
MPEPWQIRLYRRSIKKKETMRAVLRLLPLLEGKRCLEIGCATGTSSLLLRQRGGEWVSADFQPEQVESARQLLGERVELIGKRQLPFGDGAFDIVVGLNFLEHLHDDVGFVREMARVLKTGGHFLLTCPDGDSSRLGFQLKRAYGFTARSGGFGHVRDGYSRSELENLVSAVGLELESLESYSRIFTEFVENSLNYVYHRSANHRGDGKGTRSFHGDTAPASLSEFEAVTWKYRAYAGAYPLLRGLSLLDRVIPFSEGYMFAVRARKPLLPAALPRY